ncbi:MAG: response regulator [Pseudomonadota bacterium]
MPDTNIPIKDIPILVVDDAKFSSAVIAKVLRAGGFDNVRFTHNPREALRSLEKKSVQILIADWLMPGLDGLELTRQVKKADENTDHFTYVILMTARDDPEGMVAAFSNGVDDFINKAHLRTQLLPRVLAAGRIASRQNDLISSNRKLQKKVREFQSTDVIDPVTGLGNQKFTLDSIASTLKQAETRSGAACLLLIGINNLGVVKKQYDTSSIDELISGISAKIRSLVRPLDVVTRPEANIFAVTMLQDDLKAATSQSFKRLFDSLYMHSFKTSEGYIPVVVGVSISAADSDTGFPDAKALMNFAYKGLTSSFETGVVSAAAYSDDKPKVSEHAD